MESENPIKSNPPSPETKQDTAKKDSTIEHGGSPVATRKMEPPPSHSSYKITCDKKRDGWDYAKIIAEFIGLLFLIAYTIFAGKQWCEMKRANNLTSASLELSKKMFAASQAAGLECRQDFFPNVDRPWILPRIIIICANKGKTNASNVTGEIKFTRTGPDGKIAQEESRTIDQKVIIEGDGTTPQLFVVTKKFDFEKYSRQRIRVEGAINYDNGISRVPQNFCQELIVTPVARSYGWTTCENADTERKYPSN